MIEIDWQNKAEALWRLLDDIDTASDMFKPHDEKSYKSFYHYAMMKCTERGKYMISLDGYTLTAGETEKYEYDVKTAKDLFNKALKQVEEDCEVFRKAESQRKIETIVRGIMKGLKL